MLNINHLRARILIHNVIVNAIVGLTLGAIVVFNTFRTGINMRNVVSYPYNLSFCIYIILRNKSAASLEIVIRELRLGLRAS